MAPEPSDRDAGIEPDPKQASRSEPERSPSSEAGPERPGAKRQERTSTVQLRELCGYRAGDKGDIANVAIFADDDETYELIVREVTPERVKELFGPMVRGRVERYEVPNVRALNFVLHDALGGGGPRSLRADNLGKTLGGALVRLEIDAPDHIAQRRRPRPDVSWADGILFGH